MTHTIDINNPAIFKSIKDGIKTYMILKDDRNYISGDTIVFQILSEREECIMVIDSLEVETPGLKNGYVSFAIKPKE